MKRWLAVSLILNIGLLGLLLLGVRPSNKTVAVEVAGPSQVVMSEKPAALQPLPTASVTSTKRSDLNSWLDQLRAAGVPNKILASVTIAAFEDHWDAKEQELQRQFDSGDVDADALTQAESERVAERERTLRAALGEQGFRQWDKENTLHDMNLGNLKLSDAESDSLYQLRKGLLQGQHDVEQASRNGEIDEADLSQKLSALQTQYNAQARTLLGDDRYTAMNSSPDPVNADLLRKTKDLHPTDEQFTALTEAQKQWNDQRATLDRQLESAQLSPDQHDAQMQALDVARDKAYQQALGTNGFADFQKTQDANYQAMKHYSAAWQLNDQDIDYLYRTIQSYKTTVANYQQQAKALQSQGQTVDWNDVQRNISQFSGQVGQTLQSYLGDDRFKKLEQNNIFSTSN